MSFCLGTMWIAEAFGDLLGEIRPDFSIWLNFSLHNSYIFGDSRLGLLEGKVPVVGISWTYECLGGVRYSPSATKSGYILRILSILGSFVVLICWIPPFAVKQSRSIFCDGSISLRLLMSIKSPYLSRKSAPMIGCWMSALIKSKVKVLFRPRSIVRFSVPKVWITLPLAQCNFPSASDIGFLKYGIVQASLPVSSRNTKFVRGQVIFRVAVPATAHIRFLTSSSNC